MGDYWRLTASELAAKLRGREVSAEEVARDALSRLEAANPAINAVVDHRSEEVLAEAREVDRRLGAGEDPGPLAGVPVTIKVNADQVGHATTNGLRIQRELIAKEDNPVVSNFRRAGAVVLGRTNTPAFSLRWFTRNALHGNTRNPRDPRLTPGGSSGGAAASLAAGIGALAHGTDIGGSVRYPAYACGVHGLRPTLGRIAAFNASSPERAIGAQLMAVSGPLARSIPDLRAALAALAAPDPRDPWWVPAPLEGPPLPKRAALCVRPEGLATHPAVEKALRAAALALQEAGWTVVETPCPPLREPAHLQALLWLAESRRSGNKAYQAENEAESLAVLAMMEARAPEAGEHGVADALTRRAGFLRQWNLFLERYPLVLLPVSAEPPFPDALDIESEASFERVIEAQLVQIGLPLMGLPALTVATSGASSAPMGVQLVAGRYREDLLLEAGAVIAPEPIAPVEPVTE
ncbi:Amidase family protein [Roseomonas mucosa]|uniref:Amidase n=1 Tax=Roseomonas mucosa TaxID=207340 RepID=A0A1S8DBW6_9PROT|nr:amidase family protein [Roseomonas mucosa]ONH84988.1 amidase [Roseomonas mucosa]QDJ08087.1 Amidase family protein [Roseomonas mucosa]